MDVAGHPGTLVAETSAEATAEVFRLRLLLEPAVCAAAVQRMTPQTLERLEGLHARVADADDVSNEAFADRDAEWHRALYDAAGSAFLSEFIRRLWESFPGRAMVSAGGGRAATTHEHEATMVAIRSGDADAVIRTMRSHIERCRDGLQPAPGAAADEVDIAMSAWYGEAAGPVDGRV